MKILIVGNGDIGTRCKETWGDEAILSNKRIQSVDDVRALIDEHAPDAILNAAGKVGKPNVDWCEDHQVETIYGNTVLPLQIAEAAQEKGIYLLHLGTGCIFYGASTHPDKMWREDDFANPVAVYTRSKYAADLALSTMKNVGIARLRMPTDHTPHPVNLIDKITHFPRVVDVENSITVVDDLVLALRQLIEKRGEGIFHTVNPGSIRHREIIELYQKLVDSNHHCEWITEEELVSSGLAKRKRSNNIMKSERLEALGIHMRDIHEAMLDTMQKYASKKKN